MISSIDQCEYSSFVQVLSHIELCPLSSHLGGLSEKLKLNLCYLLKGESKAEPADIQESAFNLVPLVMSQRIQADSPRGTVGKNLPASAGDMGSIRGQEGPTCHGAAKRLCHDY